MDLYEIFMSDAPDYGVKVCQVMCGYLENLRNDKERTMAHRTKKIIIGWPKLKKNFRETSYLHVSDRAESIGICDKIQFFRRFS